MSPITYHIPDHLIDAYAAGALPHAFAVVVAQRQKIEKP